MRLNKPLKFAFIVFAWLMLSGRSCTETTISTGVQSAQKISDTAGNFEGELQDSDRFGSAVANAGIGMYKSAVILAAMVLYAFEPTLDQIVATAVLFPIVMSMGGIAGTQTLTLMIRGMATGQVSAANTRALLRKELAVGMLNGILFSIVIAAIAMLWYDDVPLGLVMAAAILKPLAEVGAAMHMLAHAFGKITLFFAAGAIYTASKKTELWQLDGIGRRMPVTMTAFTIGALSMIGVPPTAGFISKWYILAGAFQADNYLALATIIASTALNAAYFLPIVYAAWFRPDRTAPGQTHGEAPFAAVLALVVSAAMTLAFFGFSAPAYELEAQLVRGQP